MWRLSVVRARALLEGAWNNLGGVRFTRTVLSPPGLSGAGPTLRRIPVVQAEHVEVQFGLSYSQATGRTKRSG